MGLRRINGREVESHPLMLDFMAVILPACASFTVLSDCHMLLGRPYDKIGQHGAQASCNFIPGPELKSIMLFLQPLCQRYITPTYTFSDWRVTYLSHPLLGLPSCAAAVHKKHAPPETKHHTRHQAQCCDCGPCYSPHHRFPTHATAATCVGRLHQCFQAQ